MLTAFVTLCNDISIPDHLGMETQMNAQLHNMLAEVESMFRQAYEQGYKPSELKLSWLSDDEDEWDNYAACDDVWGED